MKVGYTCPFLLFNIAIRKFRITYMAHIIFLLDISALESLGKGMNLLE